MTQQGWSGGLCDAECLEPIQLCRSGFAEAGEALFAQLHAVLLLSSQ